MSLRCCSRRIGDRRCGWRKGVFALCVGASIDFLTGKQKRAPRAMQRTGLEWPHRLASDPSRMWRRYLVRGPGIFRLAARQYAADARRAMRGRS